MAATRVGDTLNANRLANAIEKYGSDALRIIVEALRASGTKVVPAPVVWRKVDEISGFDHAWPEVHEHYPPMPVYEGLDEVGPVRFCIGVPEERMQLYGRDRGWASVWEVINRQPREQRAVFVDTDRFAETRDRVALISGKDGGPKKLFEPDDLQDLPVVYDGMRIVVHRDVCSGPYAKNRLGVLANENENDVMLNHALAHLRLRG